jgi:hypothetical protein
MRTSGACPPTTDGRAAFHRPQAAATADARRLRSTSARLVAHRLFLVLGSAPGSAPTVPRFVRPRPSARAVDMVPAPARWAQRVRTESRGSSKRGEARSQRWAASAGRSLSGIERLDHHSAARRIAGASRVARAERLLVAGGLKKSAGCPRRTGPAKRLRRQADASRCRSRSSRSNANGRTHIRSDQSGHEYMQRPNGRRVKTSPWTPPYFERAACVLRQKIL